MAAKALTSQPLGFATLCSQAAVISSASWALSQHCQPLTALHDQGDLWGSVWRYDVAVGISFPDRLRCWTSCHLQQCGCDGSDN